MDQRWAAIGENPPDSSLRDTTPIWAQTRLPRFQLLNQLLTTADEIEQYDYVFLLDDDIWLPESFVEPFLDIQERLQLGMAQPARTSESSYTFPIVLQQPGLLARETNFVEVGPLISFSRGTFRLVYPFDDASGMGWGLEYMWAFAMRENGIKMGIVDALAVKHTLRPSATYDSSIATQQQTQLLARHPHLSPETAHRVIEIFPLAGGKPEDYADLLVADWLRMKQSILLRGRRFLGEYGLGAFCRRLAQPWLWWGRSRLG
jgi:hypothetical protein